MAANCKVAPTLMDGFVGAMLMETSAGWTFSVVAPEILPRIALIDEVPGATPVARPPLLIAATRVLDELQVTLEVIVFVVPSVYVPLATNGTVPPAAIVGLAGVTPMETSAGAETVSVVEPGTVPDV